MTYMLTPKGSAALFLSAYRSTLMCKCRYINVQVPIHQCASANTSMCQCQYINVCSNVDQQANDVQENAKHL